MQFAMHATKLVVRDVTATERFYCALGLKLVNRNTGGEGDVRQEQSWLSASGDMESHVLILTRFTELPAERCGFVFACRMSMPVSLWSRRTAGAVAGRVKTFPGTACALRWSAIMRDIWLSWWGR
jgi:catechol 2,3-dioxygenase-like lactoylglutathione lyase family enzyme